jgi:hypothetical protein
MYDTVQISRVEQNRVYTPYMTVYLVISLPQYRLYTNLANPTNVILRMSEYQHSNEPLAFNTARLALLKKLFTLSIHA